MKRNMNQTDILLKLQRMRFQSHILSELDGRDYQTLS